MNALRWMALPFSFGIYAVAHFLILGLSWLVAALGLEDVEIKGIGGESLCFLIGVFASFLFFEAVDWIQPYPKFERLFLLRTILCLVLLAFTLILIFHCFSWLLLLEMVGYGVGAWVAYNE